MHSRDKNAAQHAWPQLKWRTIALNSAALGDHAFDTLDRWIESQHLLDEGIRVFEITQTLPTYVFSGTDAIDHFLTYLVLLVWIQGQVEQRTGNGIVQGGQTDGEEGGQVVENLLPT